ncbi:MAG: bifunctional phosphopantothenoylcysteine decarboxylase/phosphopantothenate--cysteine ligase CoaBC [Armatimonadetes bacterium]|nr:bifunctional phosphopantothenoylcysteine decarboxylase/phosphopantothenate--cysteine ligase CoaBC [Armatimonadota bacterium]
MAKPLTGKTVVLGITGSIAAYKGAEVARRLMDLGADVHATLTRAGAEFITPLTLRTLSGNPVTLDMFEDPEEWHVKHISLAQRAAAVVIAPASANAIAKLALGLADEFIYCVALATQAPIVVAPAMNDRMYSHAATQSNLADLRERGVHIVEPETGRLASGAVGQGRLADPEAIAAAVVAAVSGGDLQGRSILITAGPTREPLDPIRFLSNRSSGRMGYALAEAAATRGATVTLVSGPVALSPPAGCEVLRVVTTQDMYDAVLARLAPADVVIAAGAPADFRAVNPAAEKVKKDVHPRTVEFLPTPDILAECGRRKGTRQFLVGFAAETENLVENAKEKLRAKHLDLIVANDVSAADSGIDVERNAGHLLFADGREEQLAPMDKLAFAHRVLDAVVAAQSDEG